MSLDYSTIYAAPRLTASFSRPADATAYAAGDIIANSLTANLVVPLTFTGGTARASAGRILGAKCTIAPASGSVVITALAFDLLIFRSATGIPFAAAGYPADNAALNITAAAMREMICAIPFVAAAWRNPAGGLTAGAAGFQQVSLTVPVPFNLLGLATQNLLGILQAQGAWTPTAIVNQLDFALDVVGD